MSKEVTLGGNTSGLKTRNGNTAWTVQNWKHYLYVPKEGYQQDKQANKLANNDT